MPTPKYPLLTVGEIAEMIDSCIPNERNRKILKRRLCDGATFEALSEEFSLSVRRIKQIVYEADGSLFMH